MFFLCLSFSHLESDIESNNISKATIERQIDFSKVYLNILRFLLLLVPITQ